ncbi:MAG: 50S ribosomal protein L9 [Dethiobacter sp.]|nr:50S ribosomal protein L9 [Dethiobacter sp.]
MKVILKQNLPNLGKKGDLKDVAEGYARNMLIPRDLVEEATPQRLRELQRLKLDEQKKAERVEADSKIMAERMENQVFTLAMPAGEGGRLFGSVTAADIASMLKKEGHYVDKKRVVLDKPIKNTGRHQVAVKLSQGVKATIFVLVEKGS